jgi:hypothetical protein
MITKIKKKRISKCKSIIPSIGSNSITCTTFTGTGGNP